MIRLIPRRRDRQVAMDHWWTSNLINPQALRGLYDEEPPLQGFHLLALSLEERGPNCLIRGQFSKFPDHPRPTWDVDADRLRVRFGLSAVEQFRASGRVVGGAIDLDIERAEDGFGIIVCGRGQDFEFQTRGIGLQIIGMTADKA